MTKDQLIEPGGVDPLERVVNNKNNYVKHWLNRSNFGVFWHRLFGDVFGHPKNVLDIKRPIVRSGPFSIF